MKIPISILLHLLLFAAVLCARADAGPGAIDARELGASGSTFETLASTTAGSTRITVAAPGDFRVGQGVTVSRCNVRHTPIRLWGTGEPYRNSKPLDGSVEVRGYDGSGGSWAVYVLDIAPSAKPAFRWSADLCRTWQPAAPVTGDWQTLSAGVEVRLHARDWGSGYVIAFGARDRLVSRIERIEGNTVTLADPANRTVKDAQVRHDDSTALQAAVDRALIEGRGVRIPAGHYRLSRGLTIRNARAIVIEGANAVDTLLDIRDGEGACITLAGGIEVVIRNVSMLGFMGFDERDRAGYLRTLGSTYVWGFALKPCNAVTISGTERVLIENCHASRMSGECFVSGGPSRATARPGRPYSQWITYRRCSVTDSARNAFNDVFCGTENTSVLGCRIVDVGGCAWEGASRFVKFTGNYVRNSGTVAMGNLGPANRDASYPELGAGQHIIADNVFEGGVPYGACAIRSAVGATQVIVRDNLFVNFNGSAIEASGATDPTHYASSNTIVSGNIIDMSAVPGPGKARTGIAVGANDSIVADNQIYVRGETDPNAVGIRLLEPALNLNVHDNLIRNCCTGIATEPARAAVGEVVDARSFLRARAPAGLPLDRIRPGTCCGWRILWLDARGKPGGAGESIIAAFDPDTLRFRLRDPRPMKAGDRFEVGAPSLNWLVHDNVLAGCTTPLARNGRGSATSIFRDNLVARDDAPDTPSSAQPSTPATRTQP